MNAPSQTLICNPQIEWSKLPYICTAFGLSASLPTSLVRLATSRPHEVLSELFVPRHIKSDEKTFLKVYSLVCVSVRVWSWKNAKNRWEKKKRKEREQEKKKERKKEKKHTNSIARIRAGASSSAVCFTCLKLHHAAPRKQDTFDRRISCHDHATHRLKKKHFSCGFRSK